MGSPPDQAPTKDYNAGILPFPYRIFLLISILIFGTSSLYDALHECVNVNAFNTNWGSSEYPEKTTKVRTIVKIRSFLDLDLTAIFSASGSGFAVFSAFGDSASFEIIWSGTERCLYWSFNEELAHWRILPHLLLLKNLSSLILVILLGMKNSNTSTKRIFLWTCSNHGLGTWKCLFKMNRKPSWTGKRRIHLQAPVWYEVASSGQRWWYFMVGQHQLHLPHGKWMHWLPK